MPMGVATTIHAIRFNEKVHLLFKFPGIRLNQRRRYENLKWKTYYNTMMKRNWKLVGEIHGEVVEQRQLGWFLLVSRTKS